MTRWYYQKKDLRLTPSTRAGLDPSHEARYRSEGARFIMELGTSMNLSLSTLASAVVFFHRFYMCHSFQEFPRYPAACACLFLAGKVEETPKKCKDMIESAKRLLPDPKFTEQFGTDERQRFEEVMTLERILLQTIKFDLQLEHPYKYLLKYATCLKGEKSRLEKMVQMAWNFVNDSLCTTLCLQWEPEIIAIALMYLACKLNKFDVVDWNGRESEHLRWWDVFVQDMTIEVLEDICHQVLDFYAQAQQSNNDNANRSVQNSPGPCPSTSRGPPQPMAPVIQSQPPPKPVALMVPPPPTYQQQAAAFVFTHLLHQQHQHQQQQQHQQGVPSPVPPPPLSAYPPPNYYSHIHHPPPTQPPHGMHSHPPPPLPMMAQVYPGHSSLHPHPPPPQPPPPLPVMGHPQLQQPPLPRMSNNQPPLPN